MRQFMARALPVLAAALSFTACLNAEAQAPAPADSAAKAELIALDDAWVKAEVGHDKPALEGMLHEKFLVTFKAGATMDRIWYIDYVMNATMPADFAVTHDTITVVGDTAVVVDYNDATGFTWTAVRSIGAWRVIEETYSPTKPNSKP